MRRRERDIKKDGERRKKRRVERGCERIKCVYVIGMTIEKYSLDCFRPLEAHLLLLVDEAGHVEADPGVALGLVGLHPPHVGLHLTRQNNPIIFDIL